MRAVALLSALKRGALCKECQRKFGFCAQAWAKAVQRGEI